MKNDLYRLNRIVDIGDALLSVIESDNLTKERLVADVKLQWMVSTPLYKIGEQVNCISHETADAYPDIPWVQVAGLRHRLVHDYEGTNWDMIAEVVFEDLPSFISQIRDVISDLDNADH